jgi:hypothetical protein
MDCHGLLLLDSRRSSMESLLQIKHMLLFLQLLLRCLIAMVAPPVLSLCLDEHTAAGTGTGHDCARQG